MNHQAKKRFGQNFLQDSFLIRHIVQLISPSTTDTIIEIGPGLGALTQPLTEITAPIHVIEIDNDIIEFLQKQIFADKLIIHHQDVLTFDFTQISRSHKMKILGNLPYNISTPLLFKLIDYTNDIDSMYFMLQKEVAERLNAEPGTSKFGKLSVFLQYHFDIEILLNVPPTAFDPIPKVESTIIRMIPHHAHGKVDNWDHFTSLVKLAFSMKRKTIFNNLKTITNKEILNKLNIDPTQRPEDISITKYVELSNFLRYHNQP